MLRLATPGYLRFVQSDQLTATFGGGEANVAVSFANYGIPVEYVTRLPQNEIADWCISELRKYMSVPNRSSAAATVSIYFLKLVLLHDHLKLYTTGLDQRSRRLNLAW